MTEAFDPSNRPRPNVMWWTRRFSIPLRETYQPEAERADEFVELLEQAERRLASEKHDS